MNAYNLAFKNIINVANFNVMSHKTSHYSMPFEGDARSIYAGETEEQWQSRYSHSVDFISKQNSDIICLQEVTKEYFEMLNSVVTRYFLQYSSKENLVTMVRKEFIIGAPLQIDHKTFKYSKIRGDSLMLKDGKLINIFNVHLIGAPNKTHERREILEKLAKPDSIIVGDYNDDIYSILGNRPMTPFILDNIGRVATSYSRYTINDYGMVSQTKSDQEAWTNIDNILYDSRTFSMLHKLIFPDNGLYGKVVPYLDRQPNIWVSDHSFNVWVFVVV